MTSLREIIGRVKVGAVLRDDDGRRFVIKSIRKTRPLYVSRKVVNSDDIVRWARSQGFDTVVTDLHVTVAYSMRPIDWSGVQPALRSKITCEGGARRLDRLGEDATVLRFEC